MYDAFASYSHAADGQLAPDLQSALHQFAKPWYRLRALHVFRDKTSLSATPSLWPMIQTALDEAKYFILLASPDAATSTWVDRELRHWLTSKGSERILIVLTAGQLVWDDRTSDFDRGASNALPPALAGAFTQEPLWIDLRWAVKKEQRSLRHDRFRDNIAELAATLHGRPKDEIVGEDVRQRNRTRRIAWAAACALLVLAAGLGVAAWIAFVQRNRAEERGAIALSRQLAAQAVALAGTERGDLALLLSVEALNVSPTVDARNGLLTTLTRDPRRLFHLHGHMGEVLSLAFNANGSELLSLGCEGIDVLGLCNDFGVRRWVTRNGKPLGQVILPGADRWTVLSHESQTVVARNNRARKWDPVTGEALPRADSPGQWSPHGELVVELTDAGLVLRRPETGQRIDLPVGDSGGVIETVAFDPTARQMATGGSNGEVRLWNTDDLLQGRFAPARVLKGRGRIASVIFSPDGRRLVIACSIGETSGELQLWDAASWRLLTTLAGKAPVAISPDSRILAAAGADGAVIIRDLESLHPLGRTLDEAGDPKSLVFLQGGRLLVAGGSDATLRMWRVDDSRLTGLPIQTQQGQVLALAAHSDSGLASAGEDGTVLLWDLEKRVAKRMKGDQKGPVAALDFSAQGDRLVSGGFDGTLRVWDVRSGEPLNIAIQTGEDIYAVAFDRSANRIAAAAEDGSVLLWQLGENGAVGRVVGTHLLQSDGMTGLAFGPEDRFLVSSSLMQTQFWGLVAGLPAVRPPIAGSFVALHPSGELAAVTTDSHEIQLVDVPAWRPFETTLGAQRAPVNAIAFSADGRLLASAAEDELVLWDIGLDSWRARACDIARRNLTPEEWIRYLGDRTRPKDESCPDAGRSPPIPLDASRALGLAEQSAKLGEEAESRRLFAEAAHLVAASDDAELANSICWFGALRRAAPEVLRACERAVQLEPDNVGHRDSRGVVRALMGDRVGAVADFRAYIERLESEGRPAARTAARRSWIEALEAGRDPFDDMELYRLRAERGF